MSELFPEKKFIPETNNDWGQLFEKIAIEYKPKTNSDHANIISELFHNNEQINKHFVDWSEKIAYDKNKIKEIYANTIH